MSYISKEQVAAIRAELKKEFPKLKFSVRNDGYNAVRVSIQAGDVDFSPILKDRGHVDLNPHVPYEEEEARCWRDESKVFCQFAPMFNKIVRIMKGQGWYDNSDAMTDYFDTAYYLSLSIGQWDKPYVLKTA